MTDQANFLPATSVLAARRFPRADDAYRPVDDDAREAQSATLLAMEVSSLAGSAPSIGTLLCVLRALFRTARLLRRSHGRGSW